MNSIRLFASLALTLAVTRLVAAPGHPELVETDLCIYGGTSGGVVAAVTARRLGRSVVIVEPGRHLGGLTSGGLGRTDTGNTAAIGGYSSEFYHRVGAKYGAAGRQFTFEPHIAEEVFDEWVVEEGIPVHLDSQLESVTRDGTRITEIRNSDGDRFRAAMYLDTTYEGDLMALAGVRYTVGREANREYGETLNGVRANTPSHQFVVDVDPYVTPGNPGSGLLPYIQPGDGGVPGEGDAGVQAYNFRLCLTQTPANRRPITAPRDYDVADYELLGRYLDARVAAGHALSLSDFMIISGMPNGKTDINNRGAFSTDFIGRNYDYPDASPTRRQEIHAATVGYIQGFLHFLATDPRVPVNVREEMQSWGYCRDEFQDSGGFGHQMYVREARRMVSDYVMTEHNARGQVVAPDPIGLGSYTMDSHNVQRVVQNGVVRNEGDVQVGVPAPYGIAYRSIVPARGECDNLFVTFCLSATHIAFGSARMEPVFMITSQSAATAAAFAIDDDVVVQDVDYVKLSAQLRADDQILSWGETGGAPEIVVDSVDPGALVMGDWVSSTSVAGYHGSDYLHDDNDGKGVKSVRFVPDLPEPGEYTVYLRWTAHANRATHVPVSINHDDGSATVMVDQTANNGLWVALGTYRFTPGNGGGVLIETTGTTGYVIADAAGWSRDAPARPLVNLLSGDPRGTEGDPNDPIHYLFAADRELQEPLTVRYSIGGTANGSDLQSALSGRLTIPVGRTTAELRVVPLDDDTVEGDETLVITLDSSPDYEQGDHTAVTGILHDEPFDAWRARRFSKEQLPEPGVAGETDDPDHDRVPNLAEFFGGGNPLVADEGPQMGIRLADGVVWVDLVRTREAGRLVITPEGGTTLGTLAPMAPTAPVMVFREGPLERLRFSMERFSGLTEPQRFYRFSLQHPTSSPTR